MKTQITVVITTIQSPTHSVQKLCDVLKKYDIPLVIVGDKRGPFSYNVEGVELLTLNDQYKLPFVLSHRLPTDHYARKNLGYLVAVSRRSACIYETDDDNAPLPSWRPRTLSVQAQNAKACHWFNVYHLYTKELIWPRGFPLDRIRDHESVYYDRNQELVNAYSPIQQGLANGSPDVDAVWRLLFDKNITFRTGPSVRLPRNTWCPINSQSTWWWPETYPLLYLPSYCSFRLTDIWRGFIAQRCLWEMNAGVVFHSSEVFQERNMHNLMHDFKEEVSGYIGNHKFVDELSQLRLKTGKDAAGENLLKCYEQLVTVGFFPKEELILVSAWLDDFEKASHGM